MENKTIWLLSELYYPIVTSTGYYITEIAEYLAAKGLNVGVICGAIRYNESSDYVFKNHETHNGVKIYRVNSANSDKNNFLKRIVRLFFIKQKFLQGRFTPNQAWRCDSSGD